MVAVLHFSYPTGVDACFVRFVSAKMTGRDSLQLEIGVTETRQ
jgi:hypothetical protein